MDLSEEDVSQDPMDISSASEEDNEAAAVAVAKGTDEPSPPPTRPELETVIDEESNRKALSESKRRELENFLKDNPAIPKAAIEKKIRKEQLAGHLTPSDAQFLENLAAEYRLREEKLNADFMDAIWTSRVKKPNENREGSKRRQGKFAARFGDIQRPTLEEYFGPDASPSFGVVDVDTSRRTVGSKEEARVEAVAWGFRTLAEAKAFAALRNHICLLDDEALLADGGSKKDVRHRHLVAVAIPPPPCTITTLDGTKTFELPAEMPLASNSLLATEMMVRMQELGLPALKHRTNKLLSALMEKIDGVIEAHRPKLSPGVRAAWADEYVRYAVNRASLIGDEDKVHYEIPNDASLWDKHLVVLIKEPLAELEAMWRYYDADLKMLAHLTRIVQLADFEMPEIMIGPTSFFVAPPGVPCRHYRSLSTQESFEKQRKAVAQTALAASFGVREELRKKREEKEKEDEEDEKDEEDEEGELLSDIEL